MKVKALAFQVIIACIFWCLYLGIIFRNSCFEALPFIYSPSSSEVGAQVISINSCSDSFFGVGVMWLQA